MNRREMLALSPLALFGAMDKGVTAQIVREEAERLLDDEYRARRMKEIRAACGDKLMSKLARAFVTDALRGRPRVLRFVLRRMP